MSEYLTALKDVIIVLSPVIVAYLSYRSNKKTEEDIRLEIEKNLKEKDAETEQILRKINADLESQKQLATWNSSLPQTDEYIALAGAERYGNISALTNLVNAINNLLDQNTLSKADLQQLKALLCRITLPNEEESLFVYEVICMFNYKKLLDRIEETIRTL